MWYALVRMVFGFGLVWVPLLFLIEKTIPWKRVKQIIGFILFPIVGILVAISTAFPVENFIFSFPSPKAALAYKSFGKVIDTVHGERSCLVVYDPPHSKVMRNRMLTEEYDYYGTYRRWYSSMIISKTSTGYKLPNTNPLMPSHAPRTPYELNEDGHFNVYHVEGTNDYYLYGTTSLTGKGFELVYGYSNSLDDLKSNLKRISVTLELGSLPTWEFIEEDNK